LAAELLLSPWRGLIQPCPHREKGGPAPLLADGGRWPPHRCSPNLGRKNRGYGIGVTLTAPHPALFALPLKKLGYRVGATPTPLLASSPSHGQKKIEGSELGLATPTSPPPLFALPRTGKNILGYRSNWGYVYSPPALHLCRRRCLLHLATSGSASAPSYYDSSENVPALG